MTAPLRLEDYDYELPAGHIAREPAAERAGARLMHWRAGGGLGHHRFRELPGLLRDGDLLVLNDTRVLPARLRGEKAEGGAAVELLLLRPLPSAASGARWEAMLRPGRRLPPRARIRLGGGAEVEAGVDLGGGRRELCFPPGFDVVAHAHEHGELPLPPYLGRPAAPRDRERYQTVFARHEGSVAAPTAGLHFDEALLGELEARGCRLARLTLHVGYGTFRPLDEDQLAAGELHREPWTVPAATSAAIAAARTEGRRIVAVGTTSCRTLETLPPEPEGELSGETGLFLRPGHRWRHTDVLLTNFHLPRSSLLLLVDAFAGGRWREAYREAVERGYRFYSYGDANLIERDPQ